MGSKIFHSVKYIILILLIGNTTATKLKATTVTFDPLSITVIKDTAFTINIIGKGFEGLAGGEQIGLKFEGSIVEVTNVFINSHFDFDPDPGSRTSQNTWEGMAFDIFTNEPAINDFVIATVELKSLNISMSTLELFSGNLFSKSVKLSASIINSQL